MNIFMERSSTMPAKTPKTVKVEMTVTIKSGAFSDGYPITVCMQWSNGRAMKPPKELSGKSWTLFSSRSPMNHDSFFLSRKTPCSSISLII